MDKLIVAIASHFEYKLSSFFQGSMDRVEHFSLLILINPVEYCIGENDINRFIYNERYCIGFDEIYIGKIPPCNCKLLRR